MAAFGKKKGFVYPLSLMVSLAILSTVLANKIVAIGSFFVPGGLIVFSATYLLSDIISEQWGRSYTKKAIWCGFLANAVVAISIYLTLILPSAPYAVKIADSFSVALKMTSRIIFASFFSYILSQYFDLWGFFYLKKLTNNKHLWLRNAFSTLVAQFISTTLFIIIAFWGIFPIWKMFVSLFILKIVLLIVDIPFIYLATWWFKKSEQNDQKIDDGKNFGLQNSPNFKILYHDNLDLIASWALEVLPTENFKIADYGGGNGIVSKKIIDALTNKGVKNFTAENIDNDKGKFVEYKNLTNIQGDVFNYQTPNNYDLSICRLLLHLFEDSKRVQLLKNIYDNTKSGGYILLGNYVVDDEKNYNIKRKILNFIESRKGISNRYIPKTNEVEKLVINAGFNIVKEEKLFYDISIADFYKNRFGLTTDELNQITKIVGVNDHQESQIFILAKK